MPSPTVTVKKASWWDGLLILGMAAVFGYAGIIKLQGGRNFSHEVARFDVLPPSFINSFSITLPFLELLLAMALFVPALKRPALLGVLICCLFFAAVLSSAIIRGIPVSCGCFGSAETPSLHAAWWALGRDLVLIAAASVVYLRCLIPR